MTQRRQRLADFEARSVQLIAACTLGLAGMASVPPAHAARITGQAHSFTGASGNNTSNGPTRGNRTAPPLLQAGKARS
ncbi:hypothetical protein [Hydrogenophaga sp.]|uniref:hypothetical protein n=1 Tax=Hydrogenophaga sp. TaxID=1904254 RepID=UPI0025C2F602|nr:hypothetical protein [Hydrogenophaga sp.]MBT9464022.1 hypothetical protein [Hydrogenophaga sp.]